MALGEIAVCFVPGAGPGLMALWLCSHPSTADRADWAPVPQVWIWRGVVILLLNPLTYLVLPQVPTSQPPLPAHVPSPLPLHITVQVMYRVVVLPTMVQALLVGGAVLLARAAGGDCASATAGNLVAGAAAGVVIGPSLAVCACIVVVGLYLLSFLLVDLITTVALPALKGALQSLRGKVAAAPDDAASVASSI